MQAEMEDVGGELPDTLMMKVCPSSGVGYAAPMLVALGSSSSSCHYTQMKLVSTGQKW